MNILQSDDWLIKTLQNKQVRLKANGAVGYKC